MKFHKLDYKKLHILVNKQNFLSQYKLVDGSDTREGLKLHTLFTWVHPFSIKFTMWRSQHI